MTPEEAARIQELKATIIKDVTAWANEHIVGRVAADDLVEQWDSYFRDLVERQMPGYTGRLISPRIEGAKLIADGTILEKL